MRSECGAERAGKEESVAEEMRGNGDKPENREVPDRPTDWMRDECRDGEHGYDDIYFSFLCEIKHGKKQGEEANNRSCVFNLRSVNQKIKKLHKKDGYCAWNTSDKRACDRRKRVIDGKLDLRSRQLRYWNL